MSPSASSLSLRTASTTSPESTVVFVQDGFDNVDETTYFGIVLNLSANSPSRSGQAAAKPSYVRRPSNSAAALMVSATLNWLPSSPRSISNVQPSCRYPSPPPGASITPSSEMN